MELRDRAAKAVATSAMLARGLDLALLTRPSA
jgi:hypothetical protein